MNQIENNQDAQIDSSLSRQATIREESTNEAFLDALLDKRKSDLIVPASTKLGQSASEIFKNLVPTTLYQ